MDKTLQRLASKFGTVIDCNLSGALGRAEALAQELLSVFRNDLGPELLIDRRGRRPHITTILSGGGNYTTIA